MNKESRINTTTSHMPEEASMRWLHMKSDTRSGKAPGRSTPCRRRRRALPQLETLEGRLVLSSFTKHPSPGRVPSPVSEVHRHRYVIALDRGEERGIPTDGPKSSQPRVARR